VELVRKPLRRAKGDELQTTTIVLRPEGGGRFPADITRVCIRDEAFCATTGSDEAMTAAVLARFLGHEQNHRSGISRRITGVPDLSQLPLAANLERYFLDIARADVRQRHDRYLAARLGAHISGDAFHALHRIGLKDVSEIVDQSRWRRELDTL
jgi:hypothetical protein